jgi:hypothetical protein
MKWEYTFYSPSLEPAPDNPKAKTLNFTIKEMDALGEAGWEAVGYHVDFSRTSGAVLFKRPKPEQKP